MSLNLRCRHDISAKKKVAVLADDGWGWDAISSALALPGDTVKQWIMTYRACLLYTSISRAASENGVKSRSMLASYVFPKTPSPRLKQRCV